MGFPWKKGKKGSRISRMVADLQSPKRGNSLVVETGFPTSLIDLFVKNKDRLKKPPTLNPNKCRKNKKKVVEEEKFIKEEDVLAVSDLVPERGYREEEMVEFGGVELVSEEEKVIVKEEEESGRRVLVFGVVLRVLVVVLVLGLSVKEMAFGVTVSAFLLIVVECSGRRFVGWVQAFLDVVGGGLIGRVLCLFQNGRKGSVQFLGLELGVVEVREVVEEGEVGFGDVRGLVGGVGLDSQVEEIQVVELVAWVDGEEGGGKELPFDLDDCGGRCSGVGIVKVDGESNGSEKHGRERGRSGRIRAKVMKKLMPKKFRSGKKGKECKEKESDSGDGASSCLGDHEVGKIKMVKKQRDCNKKELEDDRKLFMSRLVKDKEEEEGQEENVERGHGVSGSGPKSLAKNSVRFVEEKVEIQGKGNVGYVMLFLIVLTGLVGGRVLAFLLTVGSCLMLKGINR